MRRSDEKGGGQAREARFAIGGPSEFPATPRWRIRSRNARGPDRNRGIRDQPPAGPALILISTPAGKLSLLRASMVLLVG